MPDIEWKKGEGDGGNRSTSSKKFKLSKPMIYVIGAVVIILFLLISRRGNSETYITDDGMPNNDVDYDSKLSNFNDIMSAQVDTTLNAFAAEQNADWLDFGNALLEKNKEQLDNTKTEYQKKLDDQAAKMGKLESSYNESLKKEKEENLKLSKKIDDLSKKIPVTKPAPKPVVPVKKPVTPKKPVPKPTPVTPKYKTVTVKKGDTLSQLSEKYGKGGSKAKYMENAKFNKLSNPDKLKIGQKIKILI